MDYANANILYKLTFQLIITHRKYKLQHPVNPLILDILIQTTNNPKHKPTSCTSLNPEYPDSDNQQPQTQTHILYILTALPGVMRYISSGQDARTTRVS
ncbi:MAG: hypothetical protein HEQ27_15100 [Dolichospermum sp. JUN01]|nr:hypothetical protein [Dolichospermum sp. JUN01]MCS6280592.1 hypothetical protein [Dolichospermum sp.]